jgi:PAS domain-containing protein
VRQRSRRPADRPVLRGRLLSDVFDVFPAGILIVSDDRRVLTWNPAVAEFLGSRVESAATCCEIFGCRTEETELAEICLTELAIARGRRLRDYTVDVPDRPGHSVLVTATAFNHGSGRNVLFSIRPTPAAAAAARKPARSPETIRIRTFGETVIQTPGAEIRGGWLDQRAGRLLKFLSCTRCARSSSRTVHHTSAPPSSWRATAATCSTRIGSWSTPTSSNAR